MASLLHELGMFGLPDTVRAKAPWHLSEEEASVVQQYPLIGATLLSEIHGMQAVIDIIETHAENFDGSGFPSGLRGSSIPLLGRIARLADGIDTFSMHYTGPNKIEAITVHLNEHRGKLYDPELVPLALTRVPLAYRDNRREVRRMDIGDAAEGLALASNVYNDDGRLVARQGAVLTRALLTNLGMWIDARKIDVVAPEDLD
jgi:response regulator RpfG family c-di-GMP phosphodiesterase